MSPRVRVQNQPTKGINGTASILVADQSVRSTSNPGQGYIRRPALVRCLEVKCSNYCPDGLWAVDKNGCPTCQCQQTSRGGRHVQCPAVKCSGYCPVGQWVVDRNGCPTCQCRQRKYYGWRGKLVALTQTPSIPLRSLTSLAWLVNITLYSS